MEERDVAALTKEKQTKCREIHPTQMLPDWQSNDYDPSQVIGFFFGFAEDRTRGACYDATAADFFEEGT